MLKTRPTVRHPSLSNRMWTPTLKTHLSEVAEMFSTTGSLFTRDHLLYQNNHLTPQKVISNLPEVKLTKTAIAWSLSSMLHRTLHPSRNQRAWRKQIIKKKLLDLVSNIIHISPQTVRAPYKANRIQTVQRAVPWESARNWTLATQITYVSLQQIESQTWVEETQTSWEPQSMISRYLRTSFLST